MKARRRITLGAAGAIALAVVPDTVMAQQPSPDLPGMGPSPALPPPDQKASITNFSRVIGWSEGRTPAAPPGFTVSVFASGLDSPRWLYVLPNGDVLVAEARSHPRSDTPPDHRAGMIQAGSVGVSANRITLLRDADRDGTPELKTVLIKDLNQPFGMALVGDSFFVANTDGLLRFPYKVGDTRIEDPGVMVLALPFDGYNNHWTRNVLAGLDGKKLYISVGSASNAGEHGLDRETRRANILEMNLDGSGERVFASGLRNPVGMAWEPATKSLWTAVNERDGLGDDLVTVMPDGSLLVADDAGNSVWRVQATP